MRTITRKVCSGLYEVRPASDRMRYVTLERRDDLGGWMAIASWDRDLYTDAVRTKRQAFWNAEEMLREARR